MSLEFSYRNVPENTYSDSSNKGQTNLRRRTKITEKKIADDEFMAASIGDVEWLKQSLRDKKDGLSFDKNGLTPLHLAAIHGRLDCLKLLIEKHKVDVNLPSTTGWRPVHLAISNQTGKRALQCLTYLLNKGADPSVTNEDGITPCHQAASEGHVQCLKLLIEVNAKVSGKDCRDHTPLDLAKLWGHRKCARILSAEIWHKEKDHVAKEMNQLKRLKMQQVLKELDQEEQFKADQEFYGDIAFKEWMTKHKLDKKPKGTSEMKQSDLAKKEKSKIGKESLYKANSMRPKPAPKVVSKPPMKTEEFQGRKGYDSFRLSSLPENPESQQKEECRHVVTPQRKKSAPPNTIYTNPNEWVKSTKVPPTEYTVNLSDDYPRDAYTMMPIAGDAPKFYDGSFWRKIETPKHEAEKLRGKKLRNPDLPHEMVERVMSRDHSRQQRPFIFKPVHIHDVNVKRKLRKEIMPRSEASLHMCDDISSILFQQSLQESGLRPGSSNSPSSKSSSRTTITSDLDRQDRAYSETKILTALQNLSTPKYYPPVRGEEYDLHLVK
ncbi:ankyrin repeat, SAM and basic leucine zipper domain-containing protein 1-like [Liolophura sinensis]|uniref:ankyrin repeat, SAM and basic leucine zipper domain-containing protein 1-like n=1 Tax=Liolophura sinensis TaxID=3198878 RepID=UPI003158F710